MIRPAGVRTTYRGVGEVPAGIDLDLEPGRPVAVVGGNGTGRSTQLRIVAGCTAPTAGSVTGRPPVVGFLPGRIPASARMPVRAYLRHMAALHGTRRRAAEERAAGLLAELGCSGDADAPVAQLSTGNVQKVGLVQALTCGAGLLVLDEPWSALDAGAAAVLDRLLQAEAKRRGARRRPHGAGGGAAGEPRAAPVRGAPGARGRACRRRDAPRRSHARGAALPR